MRIFHIIGFCFGVALLFYFQNGVMPQSRPITEADSVIVIYTLHDELVSSGGPQLLVSVWSDGHIIWSNNKIRGGPPYRSGSVEPAKVKSLLSQLERDNVFTNKKLLRANFGPDAATTVVFVKKGKQLLKMQSWHELYEERGMSVALERGLTPLGGRNIEEALKHESKDYQNYRATWKRIRGLVRGLIPKKSSPMKGTLSMKAGFYD